MPPAGEVLRSIVGCFALIFLMSRAVFCFNGLEPARTSGSVPWSIRPTKGACPSQDIRNSVENFNKLTNCTVIEGELHILLIDHVDSKDNAYENLSFPDLVEITDHLLLYRVYGLKTLRNIFPNLAVIRGHNLFTNYALIAYEMPDLEELGLAKLTSIPRGAVRLAKNAKLCFIETIDWKKIAPSVDEDQHFFKDNRARSECPNQCPDKCVKTLNKDGRIQARCWTISDCQQMLDCPPSCDFCNGSRCCSSQCIGGCSAPRDSTKCTSCRTVLQQRVNETDICAERCIPGTYSYMKRRCLLMEECNYTKLYHFEMKSQPPILKTLTPAEITTESGQCVRECPAKYRDDPENKYRCILCSAKCPKVCRGTIVDNVAAAQLLKDCTIIEGPLEINIMGGTQIGVELEKNLGQIEEVRGHIRVYHSYALLSLHFFRNLTIIGGPKLYKDRYSLVIFDNLNLQELFLEEVSKKLTIKQGTVWFHYNRKLCLQAIYDFLKDVNITVTDDVDISKTTNGDQTPCEKQKIDLKVVHVMPHLALLRWSEFKIADSRHLISYSINYKESPEKNASIFQGRDACSGDLWKTSDYTPDEDKDIKFDTNNTGPTYLTSFIHNLKPWTQYAVYIQTITISSAVQGGISDVVYLRTAPDYPTNPTEVKVRAENENELFVTWNPPNKPNGNVTHYEVYWQLKDLDRKYFDLRDYCQNPLTTDLDQKDDEEDMDEKKNETLKEGCCACPPTEKENRIQELERIMDIRFQDFLQNEVYIKRLERPATTIPPRHKNQTKRSKRFADSDDLHPRGKYSIVPGTNSTVHASKSPDPTAETNRTENETDTTANQSFRVENPFYKAVVYSQEFIIPNLGHFEDYSIEVIACQERDPRDDPKNKDLPKMCSNRAISNSRTLPSKTADLINASTIQFIRMKNSTNAIRVEWEEPPNPNGLIVAYDLEVGLVGNDKLQKSKYCITHKDYRLNFTGGYLIEKLNDGNHSIRIQATSLAGPGNWTEPRYFVIPSIEDPQPPSEEAMIVGVIVGLVVVIIVTVFVVWFVAKRKFGREGQMFTSANPDYPYMLDLVYEPDEWEVDRDKVELLRELGQGSFGMVYEGIVSYLDSQSSSIRVAVKTVNENATDYQRVQFLQEASIMKAFHCHHVVRLIGVVSKGQPALVLMELMGKGDLKNFLRMHRPDEEDNEGRQPPTLKQILQMAGEIADGMSYLADKKYVHRDLAARNCMVADDMTVKIGDFGMTRDIYETDYYRKGNRGLLPVRWMAPESLKDGVFTSMSDVWSYGVVLWEMATLAAQPYQGLSNEEVLRYVGSGKIMDKPEGCPDKLYDLMLKCWRYRQKQRPTFKEIIEMLVPDLDPRFQDCSYFFSEENIKHEEAKGGNSGIDSDDENGHQLNDYVDEQSLPFLGASGASNVDHGIDLEDMYPENGFWQEEVTYNGGSGSGEPCECETLRERNNGAGAGAGAGAQSPSFRYNNRESLCSISSPPNSAIGSSSDGSKESSKGSDSSYALMNGISVANGHVPIPVRTTPC